MCPLPITHPPSLSACASVSLQDHVETVEKAVMEYGVPYYEKYMPYILETVDGQVCSLSLTLSLSLSLSLSRPYASYTLCRRRVLSRERICPYKCVLRMKLCENVYVCVLRCH